MSTKGALKAFVPYFWGFVLLFYGLPLPSLLDAHASNEQLLRHCLFIIDPLVVFLSVFMFGLKAGFRWWAPLIIGALFMPTVFLYYNYTALFYALAYVFLSYIGVWCGHATRNSLK